jgi:acyl-CoA dehydrogenase
MILLDPNDRSRVHTDPRSAEILRKTIEFFETKGKAKLLADYYARPWYDDFLEFVRKERIFASLCTPAGEGAADTRWDTARISAFAEILGFYGLQYWYTWQSRCSGSARSG